MRDYRFDPTPVVLVPGETVRFTIFNAGLEVHDFVIGDADVQEAWHVADAAATPPNLFATAPPASVPPGTGGLRVFLRSGEQASVDYESPTTSYWPSSATSPGHIEKGMVGRRRPARHHHQRLTPRRAVLLEFRDIAHVRSGPYAHTRARHRRE